MESNQKLTVTKGMLNEKKKKQLNFGKRALLHFNLEIPIPSSVTALQDDSTFLT